MSADPRLTEMLSQWRRLRGQGKSPAPEELCADCPELLSELRRRIEASDALEATNRDESFISADVATAITGSTEDTPSIKPELSVDASARYTKLRFHARGGLGEVYAAEDEELGRSVALKFINWRQLEEPERKDQFRLEAEITSRLDHPGVVPVYGIGESWDGRPFYVMRFIEGESFDAAIEAFHAQRHGWDFQRQHSELQRLLRHFVSVCKTIAYTHNRGIVHRDIKPQNIMLGKYGETLMVDWGLASTYSRDERFRSSGEQTLRISAESSASSVSGSGSGTPAYMSPEQLVGGLAPVSPASDIYCLGGTLYKLLTGRIPFHGARNRDPHDMPPEMSKHVPRPLQAICRKAMTVAAEDRYATALDMADDIERWMSDEPVTVYREPLAERAIRAARRHRGLTVSISLAVVLTCVIAGVAAVLLGVTADSKHRAMVEAESAHARAEQSTERGIRVAAKFAARSVGSEIDRRWRIMQREANDQQLRELMRTINNSAVDSPEWKNAQNQILAWMSARREYYLQSTKTASWFLNDQQGLQVARSPIADSIGNNYRYRDYFHGLGHDLPKDQPLDEVAPIRAPHRSNVYISTNTKAPMVAFSVPIFDEPGNSMSPVLGILAMTAELSDFASLKLQEGQVAVLVDLNHESANEIDGVGGEARRGLIIDHPQLFMLRLEGIEDAEHLRHYLAPELVEQLLKVQQQRFRLAQIKYENPAAPLPPQHSADGLYITDYGDPFGGVYDGPWLAGFEPVFVNNENGVHNTGWFVIVQERNGH